MTSLITPAQVQALGIGLDLAAIDLQAVIDREEAELVKRYEAATGSRTVALDGGYTRVFLHRQISSVSAVTEAAALGETPISLASTDYYTEALPGFLIRLPEGQFWGRKVSITYTPIDDTPLRTDVLIQLVRIATEQAAWGDGSTIAGLSYKVMGGITNAAEWENQRAAQYARMGGLVP